MRTTAEGYNEEIDHHLIQEIWGLISQSREGQIVFCLAVRKASTSNYTMGLTLGSFSL